MRKIILILVILTCKMLFFSINVYSQNQDFPNNVNIGGNLGVNGTSESKASILDFGNISSSDMVTDNIYRTFMGSTYINGSPDNIVEYFSYRSIYGGYLNYNNRGHGFYGQGHYPRMFMEVISGNHGDFMNLPSDSPIKNGYIYQQIKGPSSGNASFQYLTKATKDNSQWLWGVTGAGSLVVAGEVNCREVRVTIDAGADHVFSEEYSPKSLDELEDYVKENKHLPNIPSEKEMLDDGLNIGEFQIKLLEKIEEIILYNIELNNKNKELEKRVQELEKNK